MTQQELSLRIDFLLQTPEVIQKLVAELSPDELKWKPSAEEFSVLENVCHLNEIEREGYKESIRRLLEEDEPQLPDLEGEKLVLEGRYNEQELAIALEDFARVRQESVETINTLVPEQLERCGNLEGVGGITLGQLLELMCLHDEAHREELRKLRERIVNGRNPFLKLRTRDFLLWVICVSLLLGFVAALCEVGGLLHETIVGFMEILFSILILWWIYRKSKQVGIDIRLFLQRTMSTSWVPLIGLVLCLFIFSLSSIYLIYYLLAYFWPSLLESEVINEGSYDPNHSVLNQAMEILRLIVLAPIIEELMFRGIFLSRWATKWGMRRAMVISALLFAILHIEMVGAFLFALCMTILYLRYRTLLVPMAAHALNNAMVVAIDLVWPENDYTSVTETIDGYPYWELLSLFCFTITLPILVTYIRHYWPKKDAQSPYILQLKEKSVSII